MSVSPNAHRGSSPTATRLYARCAQNVSAGELRVGVTPGVGGELTEPILRHLARAFPEVQVRRMAVPAMSWSEAPPPELDLQLVHDPVRAEAARATTLFEEPMILAAASGYGGVPGASTSLADAVELPMLRISPATPRRFIEFWSLAAARNFSAGNFRGEGVMSPHDVVVSVSRGIGLAAGSPSICRAFAPSDVRMIPIRDGPRVRSLLTSRLEDRRPIIDAAHRQVADLVKRVGPLILPD